MDSELASTTLSYVVAPTPANRRALCGVYLAEEPPPSDFLIGPAPAHNCHHYPAKVLRQCFTFAQFGEALGVARREHGLLLKVYLAAHMVSRDYPAGAGFGRQALDR